MKIAANPHYSPIETYLDVVMGDLRHLLDYFILYVRQGTELDRAISQIREKIPCFSKLQEGGKTGSTQTAGPGGSQKENKGKGKGKQGSQPAPIAAAQIQSPLDLPLGSGNAHQPTGSTLTKTIPNKQSLPEPIHGVKIYCRGDQTVLKLAKYVAVTLTPDEVERMSLYSYPIAPISGLINFPIRVYRVPIPESNWQNKDWSSENQSTTFLHLDPDSGWAPPYWQNEVGTVILVRDDRKELYIEHVEALCEFCQHHLGPLFEEWTENGGSEDGKRKVDYEITKKGFEAWFERYRIQQAMKVLGMHEYRRNSLQLNFRWERWISPYDVKN